MNGAGLVMWMAMLMWVDILNVMLMVCFGRVPRGQESHKRVLLVRNQQLHRLRAKKMDTPSECPSSRKPHITLRDSIRKHMQLI